MWCRVLLAACLLGPWAPGVSQQVVSEPMVSNHGNGSLCRNLPGGKARRRVPLSGDNGGARGRYLPMRGSMIMWKKLTLEVEIVGKKQVWSWSPTLVKYG